MCVHPRNIDLPLGDWEEVLRPLLIVREETLKLTKLSNSNSPWKRGSCDGCSLFYIIDAFILHLLLFRGTFHAKYRDSLWYSRSLGGTATELVGQGNCLFMLRLMPFTPIIEHRDADGKDRDCVTSRTSEGGQHLECANPDSFVRDLAETMVGPST
jgi:hypothetical protein